MILNRKFLFDLEYHVSRFYLVTALALFSGCGPRSNIPTDAANSKSHSASGAEAATDTTARPDENAETTRPPKLASKPVRREIISNLTGRQIEPKRILDQLENIFSARKLKPGIFVFPVTDGAGAVRADGFGLCCQTMVNVSRATAEPQIAIYPDVAQSLLIESGCSGQGAVLSDALRKACMGSVDAQLGVTGTLIKSPSGWELKVVFHNVEGVAEVAAITHPIARNQIILVPGLIAADICRRLEITQSPSELEQMLKPQVGTEEASTFLGKFLHKTLYYNHDTEILAFQEFLRINPQCTAGWRHLNNFANTYGEFSDFQHEVNPTLNDPKTDLNVATRMIEFGLSEQGFTLLQRIAPQLSGDRAIGPALLNCVLLSGNRPLFRQVIDTWRKTQSGYCNRVGRARYLIDFASRQQALRSDESIENFKLTTENRQWLEEAQADLLGAVEIHPSGWQAQNQMITLADALSLPREEMEKHFSAAISLVPANVSAYRRKLQYLSPSRHGSLDDILTFAEECIRTSRWREGIPQLFLEAVSMATRGPYPASTSYAALRHERLWQSALIYKAAAEQFANPDELKTSRSFHAWLGAVSGHLKEVDKDFTMLQADSVQGIYDREVFETPVTFQYLKELSQARQDVAPVDVDYSLRLALSAAEFDRADQLLLQPVTQDAAEMHPKHRSALRFARYLQEKKRGDLSPLDIMQVFVFQGSNADGPLAQVAQGGFSVMGKSLDWRLGRIFSTFNLYLPIGIQHGVISGEVEFSGVMGRFGILLHTRALRDVITVMYLPQKERVSVVRSRREIADYPLSRKTFQFRFEFGAKDDVLEPLAGHRLTVPVVDDVPSGITFEGQGVGAQGSVQIRNLRIELKD